LAAISCNNFKGNKKNRIKINQILNLVFSRKLKELMNQAKIKLKRYHLNKNLDKKIGFYKNST
jgi:hypothetical protein